VVSFIAKLVDTLTNTLRRQIIQNFSTNIGKQTKYKTNGWDRALSVDAESNFDNEKPHNLAKIMKQNTIGSKRKPFSYGNVFSSLLPGWFLIRNL
jgi:hypothetical protein